MKRLTNIILINLLMVVSVLYSQTVTIKAARYKLRIYNGTQDAGVRYDTNSTTAVPCGMYARYSTYSAEVLCSFSLSAIPAGATINSVSFGYNVSTRTAATHPVKIYKVSKAWSGTPQYNFFGTTAWPAADSLVSENCTATGWRTLTHARLKTLVDGWIANPATNYGVVITDDPRYYRDTFNVIGARLVVDYTLVNPPKLAVTASPNSGAVPLTVNFTATNTGGPVTTWAWTFGDGGTASIQNASHTYSAVGTYTAKLKATGSGGSDSQTVVITVNPRVYTLTIQVSGSGTTNPAPGNTQVTENTDFPITATPGNRYHFVNWTVITGSATVANPSQASTTVRIASAATIQANFEIDQDGRYRDSLALVALYNSTDGANWNNNMNWLTVQPIDTWIGVSVGNNRVDSLIMPYANNLSGTLPVQLGDLSNLVVLDIDNNILLHGPIPREIGNLANLKILNFSYNNLNGAIPPEIGNLRSLIQLFLNDNKLTGTIPQEIGQLANLNWLLLSNNELDRPIPSAIGNLTNLTMLKVDRNNLSGSIPPEIGNLHRLENFYLDNNSLSGEVPVEIGNMTSLYELFMNNNELTNLPIEITTLPIPDEVVFDVGHNRFCALLPEIKIWLNTKDPDWASSQDCPPPQIRISVNPQSGQAPLTVRFTATNIGTSDIDTWSWNFGDGSTSTEQNPVHIYSTAGSFKAKLIASGIGGSTSDSLTITVFAAPNVRITATPTSGTVPLNVTFTATNTGGPASSWLWDFGDGTTSTVQNPPVHTYNAVGSYKTVLTATNVTGTSVDSVRITVTPVMVSLVIGPRGNGTTTPSGTVQVEQGTSIPIAAAPGTGSHFTKWIVEQGNAVVADTVQPSTTVLVNTNARLFATFEPDTYRLTVTAGSNGSTTPSGTVTAQHGIPFTVRAEADVGYAFERWSVTNGSAAIGNPLSAFTNVVLTNGNAEILATFVVDTDYVPTSRMLTITGTLADSSGNPIGDSIPVILDMEVRLTTKDSLGDTIYTERFYQRGQKARGVTVDKGFFVVRLGSGETGDNLQAAIASNDNVYVEITLLGAVRDVLRPRIPITSVAYTFTGPATAQFDMNVLHGTGNPNNRDISARVGMYFVDDETGATWLRVNSGWKLVD